MWAKGWRDAIWSALDQRWDVLVIGGGITGAGILGEASRAGLRVLLVEANDFASGTSSRSSKLVHGGFRYLKNAQVKMTFEAVSERERLLREGRGLISQLGFLMPTFAQDRIPAFVMGLGLAFYDLLGRKWTHRYYGAGDFHALCPQLNQSGLRGGYRFFDAQTDDARLVLRLLSEAVSRGGTALNYARVIRLLRDRSGTVRGAVLQDQAPESSGRTLELEAAVVINATGAWVDELRGQINRPARLRRLRGSHLIISQKRLPLTRAVSLWHPADGRPVYALPWEGVIVVGTTDVDHRQPLDLPPVIDEAEIEYLLHAVQLAFPDQAIAERDIQAVFAGIRPVVNTGKADPSKESREHVLWSEDGLVTVSGGKLTTFRLMAHDALRLISTSLPGKPGYDTQWRVLDEPPPLEALAHTELNRAAQLRLAGRYAAYAPLVIQAAHEGELQPIGDTPTLGAEMRWAARSEAVVHLDDLLLRRVRLGLTLPHGAQDLLPALRPMLQAELGWDDPRWELEARRYREIWCREHRISANE